MNVCLLVFVNVSWSVLFKGDADVMREVDFVASLISFLKHHMRKIFSIIMKSTGDDDLILFMILDQY